VVNRYVGENISAMAINQAHEQLITNADGGAVGVTEDPEKIDGGWSRGQSPYCFVCAASKANASTQILDNIDHEQTERSQRGFLDIVDNMFKSYPERGLTGRLHLESIDSEPARNFKSG